MMSRDETSRVGEDARPYRAPELREWGTITELTAVGQTHPGGDSMGGSVFPQGLER